MKHFKNTLLFVVSGLTILSSCMKDTDIEDRPTPGSVNKWIYETMANNYLWYNEIPDSASLDMNQDAEEFFTLLLSGKDGKVINADEGHHYFSTIEKKDKKSKAINSESTYGFEYAVMKQGNETPKKYAALVLYVLPNSPASVAKLKRGDWIIGVNSNSFNIEDHSILQRGAKAQFYLGKYDLLSKTITPTNQSIEIGNSKYVEDTPFLKDSVYTYGDKRIGYLAYNHFTSGSNGDTDTKYNKEMQDIFASFKENNVNEFVLDLRYNGGGEVRCAQLLSSLLAPSGALGNTFCIMEYNDKNPQKNNTLTFEKAASVADGNLDLKRLFVLTGKNTASASEAVINCLIPYMGKSNITLIGAQTIGKPVGSVSYGSNTDFDWIINPIVLRIYNKDREANYEDGFTPDIKKDDLVIDHNYLELGDTNEYLLSIALAQITGKMKSTEYRPGIPKQTFIYNSIDEKKTNGMLIFPKE